MERVLFTRQLDAGGRSHPRADHRQRSDAAVRVDEVTKEQDGQNLAANLQDLCARLKSQQYRHQPIRRADIP
jgi:retron-type reverse transcriptase